MELQFWSRRRFIRPSVNLRAAQPGTNKHKEEKRRRRRKRRARGDTLAKGHYGEARVGVLARACKYSYTRSWVLGSISDAGVGSSSEDGKVVE